MINSSVPKSPLLLLPEDPRRSYIGAMLQGAPMQEPSDAPRGPEDPRRSCYRGEAPRGPEDPMQELL